MAPDPKTASGVKPADASEKRIKELETKLQTETQLRDITNRFHNSSADDIILAIKDDVQRLLDCKRVTIYVKDPLRSEIVSKVKDGQEVKEIRVAIGTSSLAGYVAEKLKGLRLADAYDANETAVIDSKLRFAKEWDLKTGFVTKQVLVAPAVKDNRLYGIVQALNTQDGKPFTDEQQRIITELTSAMATALANKQKLSVRASACDSLLRSEVITQDVYDKAQVLSQQMNISVELVLMEKFAVPILAVAQSLKEFYRSEFITYEAGFMAPPKDLLDKFTVDYLKYHLVVPLGMDGTKVAVLMANPRNLADRDDLTKRLGGKPLTVKVAIREHIIEFIDSFYGLKKPDVEIKQINIDKIVSNIEKKEAEGDVKPKKGQQEEEKGEDDASIIGLVNQIIDQAYTKGASDIHIEPYLEGDLVVRLRVDGNCFEYTRVPGSYGRAITSRLKIMSNLDIAERRIPQDGKIRFRDFGSRDIELRVATLPTTGGTEDVVMRILAASKPMKLDELRMLPETLERFKKVIALPYGIVLCVGPTGSGKTTTLHSALGSLNQPDVKIWTAEDPVEITQIGLRQVQVQAKIGFTFEKALRAFLRADPDIIMIGEMRDAETAGAAVEASLTGHLVFSTLHTNSAPETVTRLLDLGLDPYAFGDSLLGILAQRLLRSVCKFCKVEVPCTAEEFAKLRLEYGDEKRFDALGMKESTVKYFQPKGCDKCNNTGYKGRVGIHELLTSDDETRLMVYRKAKSMEIRDYAVSKGMVMLKQDGIRKVMQGLTTLQEVMAVAAK